MATYTENLNLIIPALTDKALITIINDNMQKIDAAVGGIHAHIWVRWSAVEPTQDADLKNTPDAWIGIYTGVLASAPTAYTAYAWYPYKGAQGDPGADGRGIVSVERTSGTGAPGTTDTYTITYSDETTATFDIYNGSNGAKGDIGPANALSIGTVSSGETAGASITGTAPNQTLNLILPRGEQGLSGDDGNDGREVEFQKTATHIQWRYVGGTWANLVALADITGSPGVDGEDGIGIASVALVSGTHVPGTSDTYRITFTDATHYDFTVYNGANGTGAGDMLSTDYVSSPGVVKDSAKLGGQLPAYYAKASDIPDQLSDLSDDSTHRVVTDAEKSTWNGKQNALSGDVPGHYHGDDRNRANHTGTQTASTISDFAATVRATVLTGLSTATNAVIAATDSVLSALGKLQAQITGHIGATGTAHGAATTSVNGFMSSSDKSKLDGIAAGAQVNAVSSVNTKTGAVSLTASDVGAAELDANGKVKPEQASAKIVDVSASKTLALTDAGCQQRCTNSTAITVTIDTNANVAFPVGTEIELVMYGAGSVTIAGASGVTLKSENDYHTVSTQNHIFAIKQEATDEWLLAGMEE